MSEHSPRLAVRLCLAAAALPWAAAASQDLGAPAKAPRPNVVLVVIDDMGYGDLTCHGSPHVPTPHFDALYRTASRLTQFHVAPMCTPTRGQLMTGLDAMRNGATIVASSRMTARVDAPMLPEHFAATGYATGLFGKWHLGENHPHRPEDRGFQETLWFALQEIGSVADFWCNDYFDPVFRRRGGRSEKFTGYCTDVLFDEAMRWMESQHGAGRPFFAACRSTSSMGPSGRPRTCARR